MECNNAEGSPSNRVSRSAIINTHARGHGTIKEQNARERNRLKKSFSVCVFAAPPVSDIRLLF